MLNLPWRTTIVLIVATVVCVRAFYDIRQSGARAFFNEWRNDIKATLSGAVATIVSLQLIGVDIFPMRLHSSADLAVRSLGFGLACIAAIFVTWPRMIRRSTWASPATSPEIISGHMLVTRGPYRWVRHPFYGGCLIGFAAIELILADWMVFVIVPASAISRMSSLDREEEQLIATYGERYLQYCRRTWRLLPLIY
jgi:protein-S-isoprenylcysteine O-methyltransferase Ste14